MKIFTWHAVSDSFKPWATGHFQFQFDLLERNTFQLAFFLVRNNWLTLSENSTDLITFTVNRAYYEQNERNDRVIKNGFTASKEWIDLLILLTIPHTDPRARCDDDSNALHRIHVLFRTNVNKSIHYFILCDKSGDLSFCLSVSRWNILRVCFFLPSHHLRFSHSTIFRFARIVWGKIPIKMCVIYFCEWRWEEKLHRDVVI